MSEHTIRGLYHTGVAYTAFECVDCGGVHTTPSDFGNGCIETNNT